MHRELALFAAFWLAVGVIDDFAVDVVWLWLVLLGKARAMGLPPGFAARKLNGTIAVMIPAWHEAEVIGATIGHALAAWVQTDLRLYVGCYANDPATIAAARTASAGDTRVRIVIADEPGPTTKAGCLNGLYRALLEDEAHSGKKVRAVVLHDAEDMVHPAELAVFDVALNDADFVQLPVRAEPLASSRWIAGHYLDEFAEAHTKTMVVRDALCAVIPAAGVGCAVARDVLSALAQERLSGAVGGADGDAGPFTPECLTEDYEMGWRIAQCGGRARFLRVRDAAGELVATRAYFPDTIDQAVRQKTRWTHGIAYQSWERLGWWGRAADRWMALRDRRAPLAAVVLLAAYASLLSGLAIAGSAEGQQVMTVHEGNVPAVLQWVCAGGLVWRLAMRFVCTAREYSLGEGLRAIARIPIANIIAIASARRALGAYLRTLGGAPPQWDKTPHHWHPAIRPQQRHAG